MSVSNGISSNQNIHSFKEEDILSTLSLLLKVPIGDSRNYVLKSSTIVTDHTKFAVALSNNTVKIFDIHGKLWDEYEHDKSVSDVKFSKEHRDILYTSSLDGKIRLWDTRCQGPIQIFADDNGDVLKPILCFDYNSKEDIICAGTEVIREDSFQLFWDRRSSKLLGGYWNSHSGDITQINFHPSKKSLMASSSVDGLINIFDLNETSESDALTETINVGAPINTLTWKKKHLLSCTTSIEEFHILGLNKTHPVLSKSRLKICQDFKMKVDWMIDSLFIKNRFFLITGNNMGAVHLWNIYKNKLNPGDYSPVGYLLKGHSDVVRTLCYNDDVGLILTGGDDGCICYWKLESLKLPFDGDDVPRPDLFW